MNMKNTIVDFGGASVFQELPRRLRDKESTFQYRIHRRCGFSPWVGEISWRRKWQPTRVFLPEKSHRQRSPEGCSPWHCRVGHGWATEHACVHARARAHTHTHTFFSNLSFMCYLATFIGPTSSIIWDDTPPLGHEKVKMGDMLKMIIEISQNIKFEVW